MKKVLTTIFFLNLSFFVSNLFAQCDLSLSGLKLTVNQSKSGLINNECVLNFDLSFSIAYNDGNKYIYINLWGSDQAYQIGAGEHIWKAKSAKMPRYNEMDGPNIGGFGPIAVIGINNVDKTFIIDYSADNTISYTSGKLIKGTSITSVDVNGRTLITVSGLQLKFASSTCSGLLTLKGNIWSSNSRGGTPSIHCSDDQFDFAVGGVSVKTNSSLNCAVVPRTFELTVEATAKTKISYIIYVDNGDNVLTKNSDGTVSDPTGYTSEKDIPVDLTNPTGPGYYYTSGSKAIEGLLGTAPEYKARTHYLVLSYVNIFGTITSFDYRLENNCNILPVHFKSFSAVRNPQRKEQVLLKWETATEENNRGFYVQRKVSGQWKNIAFVFSLADNGNSNSDLVYEYKEINTAGGVSQYQIQQVDMDGKTSYSEIRNVGGLNQISSVQVYPNPGVNGKVSLLFKEVNSPKDVIVNDINGRVVKQFKAVRDNSLNIDGLQSGFYSIKVMDLLTSTTTVEKVVIKK